MNKGDKKGITLIALVITVIVLLILAGISISMLSGDNSILKQAGKARDMTEQSKLEEEVDIAYFEYISQVDKTNGLRYYLNKISKAEIEELAEDTWFVSRENASVTVYKNGEKEEGKIEVWDGTSVECPEFKNFNWYIYKPSQLKFLADFVNNENTLTPEQETIISNAEYSTSDIKMDETVTVYLMNNLDLGARKGEGSTEEQKWETEANETKKWTPIGTTVNFLGIFEGNNKKIKGVYINRTENYSGLFRVANIIQNLTITDSYIKGGSGTGVIVGRLESSNTSQNLIVKDSYIKGGMHTGGVAGVVNSGDIKNTIIKDSYVTGESCVGGIVGTIGKETVRVDNCHNQNTTVVLPEGDYFYIGGVVGQSFTGSDGVYNCSNTGNIISYGEGSSGYAAQNCGGVIGISKSTVSNCENKGTVISYSGGNVTAGVVGWSNNTTEKCKNSGIVTGYGNAVGGVIGDMTGRIYECSNSGTVTGNGNNLGGVIGLGSGTIEKCINNGNVIQKNGEKGIGGVVGETIDNKSIEIKNCYNTGKLIEESDNTYGIGGILGIPGEGASGQLSHNYSIGEIEIKGSNVIDVGGVIGRNESTTFEINNNFYELNKSNVTLNSLGEGLSVSEMKTQSFVDRLNSGQETLIWELGTSNNGYPTLKE